MKKIIFIILAISVLLITTSAFADKIAKGKRFTFIGKVEYNKEDTQAYIIDDKRNKVQAAFADVDLKKATSDFQQCIGSGNYKGVIEITAIVEFTFKDEKRGVSSGAGLLIDKTSTCKRR